MGKKRIVKKEGENQTDGSKTPQGKIARKKMEAGILYVRSTYNNTALLLTDKKGNAISATSSGALGFQGAKKGTPFAAAKAGELLADRAELLGVKKIDVVIKGVGAGRESAVRGFVSKGIQLNTLRDMTPVPHNGPKPRKPRRV